VVPLVALVLAAAAGAPHAVDDGRTLRATTVVSAPPPGAERGDAAIDLSEFTDTTTPTTSGADPAGIGLSCTAETTERTTLLLRWTPLVGVPYYNLYINGEWSSGSQGSGLEQPFSAPGLTTYAIAPWLGQDIPPSAAVCGTVDVADDEWWGETTIPPSTTPPEDAALDHGRSPGTWNSATG
jgi:hypothetical protein